MDEKETHKLFTWEAILVAACDRLPCDKPFTKEAILVEAWKMFPEKFSLDGYPQFPHAQRVWSKLAQSELLVRKGLVKMTDVGTYCVTNHGRRIRRRLP